MIKSTFKKDKLKLQIRQDAYQYIFQQVLPYYHTKRAQSKAIKTTQLYFLIAFLARETGNLIPNEILCSVSKKHNSLFEYKVMLKELHLIEFSYDSSRVTTMNEETYFIREKTEYHVNPVPIDLSKKETRYFTLEYIIPEEYKNYVTGLLNKKKGKEKNSIIKNPKGSRELIINELNVQNLETLKNPKGSNELNNNILSTYFSFYQNLSLDFDEKETNWLKTSEAHYAEDNRIYHRFHSISRTKRKYLKLDNEYIEEAFDVHNCRFTLISAAIACDRSIPQEEKDRYERLTISGKFYEEIMNYWARSCNVPLDYFPRDFVKEKVNKYLCESNKIIEKAYSYQNTARRKHLMTTDMFFKENFPHIRNYIFENKKSLYVILNKIETKIITEEICINELLKKMNIKAISLHDGIYVKESDYKYLKDNNISLEQMFYDKLFIYKFL